MNSVKNIPEYHLPKDLHCNTPQVLVVLREIEKLNITCAETKRLLAFCLEHFEGLCKYKIDIYD